MFARALERGEGESEQGGYKRAVERPLRRREMSYICCGGGYTDPHI